MHSPCLSRALVSDPERPVATDACDANHGERLARQADLAADDVRVGAELLRPGLVGQDDDGIAPGHAIFVGHERAPECGADAKDVEEVGTDREPICAPRRFVASASEGDTHQVGRGQALEARRAAFSGLAVAFASPRAEVVGLESCCVGH